VVTVAHAATTTAVVGQLTEAIPGGAGSSVLWWAWLLGTVHLTAVRVQRNICTARW